MKNKLKMLLSLPFYPFMLLAEFIVDGFFMWEELFKKKKRGYLDNKFWEDMTEKEKQEAIISNKTILHKPKK